MSTDKDADLAVIAFVVAEDLYKTVANLTEPPNEVGYQYIGATAGTFFQLLQKRGFILRYLVDNEFGEQLGGPINVFPKWYDMCGLPFICPQTSAFKVLKSKPDFAPEQGIINLSNYVEEGWVIAKELVQRCEAEDRSYVFLIANALTTDISAYLKERNDASSSKGMHSIFVFRNQVAESKTTATVKFPEHLESAIAEQYPGFA